MKKKVLVLAHLARQLLAPLGGHLGEGIGSDVLDRWCAHLVADLMHRVALLVMNLPPLCVELPGPQHLLHALIRPAPTSLVRRRWRWRRWRWRRWRWRR